MTGTVLAAKVRFYSKTDTTTFADSDMLPLVNSAKDEIAGRIIQYDDQQFVMPALFDLVASTISAREYSLPDDMLSQILTVEAAFDSTISPLAYTPVRSYPGGLNAALLNTDGLTEAKIVSAFTNSVPYYYLTRRGIYILSGTISAVTSGGKLRYRLYPADLANLTGSTDLSLDPTTSSFGMPKNFHELWARQVSIVWKSQRPKPIPLSPLELKFEFDMKEMLDSIGADDTSGEEFSLLPSSDRSSDLGANV